MADRLTTGTVTAIDRSATAVERARTRHAEHLTAGRLAFQRSALADLRHDGPPFTVAFAVNVNLFWTSPADVECQVLGNVLEPRAPVHLVYETPGRVRPELVDAVVATLDRHGLSPEVRPGPHAGLVAITGHVAPG